MKKYIVLLMLLITTSYVTPSKKVSTLVQLCNHVIINQLIKEQSKNKNVLLTQVGQQLPEQCKQLLVKELLNKPYNKEIGSSLKEILLYFVPIPSCTILNNNTFSLPVFLDLNTNRTIAAISSDKKKNVELWDITTHNNVNKPLGTFSGNSHSVPVICFSPHGKVLASAYYHGIFLNYIIDLYNTSDGKCFKTLTTDTNTKCINIMHFSPHGKILASASGDTITLWDRSKKYKLPKKLTGHTGTVNAICFRPHGKILASASNDTTIKIWNTSQYECFKTLKKHTGWVHLICFSSNGKLLASAACDKQIYLWKCSNFSHIRSFNHHNNIVSSICFSPCSRFLASTDGDSDNSIAFWDCKKNYCQPIRVFNTGLGDHTKTIYFSSDASSLISAYKGTIKQCDLKLFNLILNEQITNISTLLALHKLFYNQTNESIFAGNRTLKTNIIKTILTTDITQTTQLHKKF